MKKVLSIVTAFMLALTTPAMASAANYQSANVESPEHYQVLTENDKVLVLKMVLKPGESDRMHTHNDETVYFQQGGTLTITEHSGKSFEAKVADGDVMWHAKWSHQVTNSGDTDVVAIIVEQK